MAKILFSKSTGAFSTNADGGSLTGMIPANLEAGILLYNNTEAPVNVHLQMGNASNAIIHLDPNDTRHDNDTIRDGLHNVEIDRNNVYAELRPNETVQFIAQNGTQAGNITVVNAETAGHTLIPVQRGNYIMILRYQ